MGVIGSKLTPRAAHRPLISLRMTLCVVMLCLSATGCATMGVRTAVDLSVEVTPGTPGKALVYIDERYVGTLAALAARGFRVPEGKHRLTIEKVGYFPYDAIIISDLKPIHLKIELLALPD